MAEGKILEFPKKEDNIVTNMGAVLGTQVSAKALSMMDVMVTAEMLYTYAVHSLAGEIPGKENEIRAEVSKQLQDMKEFNLSVVKFRLFDAMQVVMTNIAELYLASQVSEPSAVQEDPNAGKGDETPQA